MYLPAANIQVLSDLCKKNGEKFYKVSYNQGFCSLLGLRGFLKKKSHNTRQIMLSIVTLLFLYEFIFL